MKWMAFLVVALVPAFTSSAVAPERASLADSLEDWVSRVEKDDPDGAARFARDADAARAMRERWELLKKCHADHNYRRWLDADPDTKGPGARRVQDGTRFTVGGHEYGHVHVRWDKAEDRWAIADVWLCR
jgi:hypothetical protein